MKEQVDFLKNYINNIKDFNWSYSNLFDIFIVSSLIYLILYLLRKSQNIRLVIGLLIIVFIYFIAIVFNLYLTNTIFKFFANAFLIILIIIFQKEIKDFFEFPGKINLRKRHIFSKDNLSVLLNSIENLKNKKLGALIVLPGKDTIDPYLENGYLINAEISEPLIESIFDTHSPGHDGAMIIKKNRIWKFGVHLPLAENFEQIKNFGLRHRAALGLSEKTDSLVIVISEEKGTISIAEKGKLETIQNINELRKIINNFLETKYPEKPADSLKILIKKITREIIFIFISISIALTLFTALNQRFIIVQRSFIVPIEFINVPQDHIVSKVNPDQLNITLRGTKDEFDSLDINKLKITIDLLKPGNLATPGWHTILTNSKNVKVDTKLQVIDIKPSNIRFYIEKIEKNK